MADTAGEGEAGHLVPVEHVVVSSAKIVGIAVGTALFIFWFISQQDRLVEKWASKQKESDDRNQASFEQLDAKVTTLADQVERIEFKVGQGFVGEAEFNAWTRLLQATVDDARITSEKPVHVPPLRQ